MLECIRCNILAEYFSEKRLEVVDIMLALFDEKKNQEMFARSERKDAQEEERTRNIVEAIKAGLEKALIFQIFHPTEEEYIKCEKLAIS